MLAAPVFCGSDFCHLLVLRAVRLMNRAQVVYPYTICYWVGTYSVGLSVAIAAASEGA